MRRKGRIGIQALLLRVFLPVVVLAALLLAAIVYNRVNATILRQFDGRLVATSALTGALNWYRGLVFSARDRHLPAVTVPTTYIWSDRDVALGRVGARLTSGWVDAPYEFITIEHANHWLPENHPDEVAGAIADRVDSVESRIS